MASHTDRDGTTRVVDFCRRAMQTLTERGRWRTARTVSFALKTVTGLELQPGAQIGNGLIVKHGQGTVIPFGAVIGADCLIHHEVTIGYRHGGCPVIGDRVSLYPGAKVIGPITVGDGAVIGPNAVVLENVASGQVVVAAKSYFLP